MKAYFLSVMNDRRKTLDGRITAVLLSLVSVLYLIALKCVYFLYRKNILTSYKARIKVISVGNITLGGTGKTPFTIFLAENIRAIGGRPAVLIRGYGDDEPGLIKERLAGVEVFTGRDRVAGAKKAFSEAASDCAILDDGFQHYRIKRDIDIVLIDATRPFGNNRLFPRGILREPLTRLGDADVAVLTKCDMGRHNIEYIRGALKRYNKDIDIAESFYAPSGISRLLSREQVPLSYIMNKKIALLSGIANPEYFRWMAENLGAEAAEDFRYPDHHPYTRGDMDFVREKCISGGITPVLTTEKDAVRLRNREDLTKGIEILTLRIDFRISSNEKAVFDRLHSIFAG